MASSVKRCHIAENLIRSSKSEKLKCDVFSRMLLFSASKIASHGGSLTYIPEMTSYARICYSDLRVFEHLRICVGGVTAS